MRTEEEIAFVAVAALRSCAGGHQFRDAIGPMTSVLARNGAMHFEAPRDRLERMELAATRIVDCMHSLHRAGDNLVAAALRGSGDFLEWDHYPASDVYDPQSRAQYYFHAHPTDDRADPDYGHFHTFLRLPTGGLGMNGARAGGNPAVADDVEHSLCHLVAISMTSAGLPERIFTTNRWVTGECWQPASQVISLLDQFSVDLEHPSRALNIWLTEMLVLFRPQIESLLVQRDITVGRWQNEYRDIDAFENRELEVTSSMHISLYDQIEWLDRVLDGKS